MNKLTTILDFEKCKELVNKHIAANNTDNVILCPLYSINIQSQYEDSEELNYDLDELQDFIGHSIEVSQYDDLIVNLYNDED